MEKITDLLNKIQESNINQNSFIKTFLADSIKDNRKLFQVRCSCLEEVIGMQEPISTIRNVFVLCNNADEAGTQGIAYCKTLKPIRKATLNSVIELKDFINQ